MTKALLLATTILVAAPFTAAAQAPAVDAAQQGVLVFEPAFFADSSPNTALDMIARLPGFGLDTGDTDTRGFAGAAGNVLIDGNRPSSKSDSLDGILRRISAASVERIELIRGGAPGIDMQGRSVIANVVLKRTVQIQTVLEAKTYVYPDGYLGPVLQASWSRREGENQLEASLSATTDRTDDTGDGYRRRYDAAGVAIQTAELDRWDRFRNVRGTAAWQGLAGGGRFRVNGVLGWNQAENSIDTLIRTGAGRDERVENEGDEVEAELGLNWARALGERTEIELTGLQRYEVDTDESRSVSGLNRVAFGGEGTAGETIGRIVLRLRQSDRWAFEGGGEAAYNFLDSATTYAENGVPVPLPSASVKVEELRGEVFGQTTWRPGPQLTVEAALRVEVSEISQSGDSDLSETFVYPKPRLQVTWNPIADHQFRFRVEREVGQLDFGDFVASADVDLNQVEGGNPELEPGKVWTYEAVYERRFWGEGALTVTLRRHQLEDIIDVIPLIGGFEAVGNIGDGWSNQQQVVLTLPMDRLGLSNARLSGRVSFDQSRVTDPLTGEERRIGGRLPFGCGVEFNQDLRGGRWSWGFEHGCNVDDPIQYRVREVRYFEDEPFVTVYGQWKPRPDLTVRLDVGNATDREQRRERFVYSGPRNSAPLSFREERGTTMSPWLFIQIRKTL
ncbi:TonB-dependent receptor domain-containing protein [Brevundimonas sp.]|uniref:TonB-dependent receptor plug domain-containing protein n=1 Tax=Brevundimonas sp. TaxID=1871086 RepID=UPI00286B3DEB|nr:TonB-dependent receptor [Brevundimonas sp.]